MSVTMLLLRAGVPLTLLLDLAPDTGPDSPGILAFEEAMAAVEERGA